MTESKTTLNIQGRDVVLSNLTKTLWPQRGFTKYDLIKYYLDIYPYLIPHLAQRPLVITRYPHGVEEKGFYQKDIASHNSLPEWVQTVEISSKRRERCMDYLIADHPSVLAWLGNLAGVEIHPWLSRVGSLEYPDFVVLDLDPMPDATFDQVKTVALTCKTLLKNYNLPAYPKLSGASGIQIFIPIRTGSLTYQGSQELAHEISTQVHERHPDATTLERAVKKRSSHHIYLDYLQNSRGKTISVVYGPRPTPEASVSAPIHWSQLTSDLLTPRTYDIKSIHKKVQREGDLFAPVLSKQRR